MSTARVAIDRDLTSAKVLDVLESMRHPIAGEWRFLREVRVGTGFQHGADQRLDAWAINTYRSNRYERIAYEVKVSRSDWRREIADPIKRRVGLLVSNLFYFVAPGGVIPVEQVPVECGLFEIWRDGDLDLDRKRAIRKRGYWCCSNGWLLTTTVPAPWRDAPPLPLGFVCALIRRNS